MKDTARTRFQYACNHSRIGDVANHCADAFVLDVAGSDYIEQDDFVDRFWSAGRTGKLAACEQGARQAHSEKSGTAGNDDSH